MPDRTTVLIADDDRTFQVCFQDYLDDEGFAVELVRDAEQLIERAHSADVLVVDVRYPTEQLEGIGAVASLARAGRLRDDVAVIFVSVLPKDEPLCQHKLDELSLAQDRWVWLQKPFELELLSNTIREELRRRRLRG